MRQNYAQQQTRTVVCLSLILLAAFVGSLNPLLASISKCGLLLPHDHILVGGATADQLEAHEIAETYCLDQPSWADKTNWNSNGHILSVSRDDASQPGTLSAFTTLGWLGMGQLALPLIFVFTGLCLLPLLTPKLIFHPPLTPPPKSNECYPV